jgi:mRNA-degrading endonuclease HigB of HigAB toxin-antitoxin module
MNTDERRAVLKIHEKYPEYELALADFIDWLRKYGHKFAKPQEIADEFEKSEFFKCDHHEEQ